MEGFQGLPYPPDCAHCGGRIGMWEPVVTRPEPQADATSWLKLCHEGLQPQALWHLTCRTQAQAASG